jgi:hypothetical protein
VWKDPTDEKEYCVFHAPQEKKLKGYAGAECLGAKEFNHLVFDRIDTSQQKREECKLRACPANGRVIFIVKFWLVEYDPSELSRIREVHSHGFQLSRLQSPSVAAPAAQSG